MTVMLKVSGKCKPTSRSESRADRNVISIERFSNSKKGCWGVVLGSFSGFKPCHRLNCMLSRGIRKSSVVAASAGGTRRDGRASIGR
jgi:hypothetical protein